MDEDYDVRGVPLIRTTNHIPYNPLKRPEISYKKAVLALIVCLLLALAVGGISGFFFSSMKHGLLYQIVSVFLIVSVYIYRISGKAVIWIVHVYQHFAPEELRLRCVYEPSCSEYMIMAVEKYGCIRGLWKGVRRLRRCHPPNYGADYP